MGKSGVLLLAFFDISCFLILYLRLFSHGNGDRHVDALICIAINLCILIWALLQEVCLAYKCAWPNTQIPPESKIKSLVWSGNWCNRWDTHQLLFINRRTACSKKSKRNYNTKLPGLCFICNEVHLPCQWMGRVGCQCHYAFQLPSQWSHNASRQVLSCWCWIQCSWLLLVPFCSVCNYLAEWGHADVQGIHLLHHIW